METKLGNVIDKTFAILEQIVISSPAPMLPTQLADELGLNRATCSRLLKQLMEMGYIPSFCTACYREGRTGDRFMALCKSQQILNCCHPNALMTLKEYLMDYATPETRAIGEKLIAQEIEKVPNEKIREIAKRPLQEIENGQRDFRF